MQRGEDQASERGDIRIESQGLNSSEKRGGDGMKTTKNLPLGGRCKTSSARSLLNPQVAPEHRIFRSGMSVVSVWQAASAKDWLCNAPLSDRPNSRESFSCSSSSHLRHRDCYLEITHSSKLHPPRHRLSSGPITANFHDFSGLCFTGRSSTSSSRLSSSSRSLPSAPALAHHS